MGTEYRVKYKREGFAPKRKKYLARSKAERFMRLLGPEPWTGDNLDPDAQYCCDGHDCGCRGATVREQMLGQRSAEMPSLEYVRLECREVGNWAAVDALPR